MKRDRMLMEAIMGQLLQSPDPWVSTKNTAQRLNVDMHVISHHLDLLQDKSFVQRVEPDLWRLTNQGHDYLEGSPIVDSTFNLS